MELFLLGAIKVLDNVISTTKSITTYQNKKVLTSILVIISQFIFYFIIKSVVMDSSVLSITIVCICSGVGTYMALLISDKFKREATYTNIMTCSSIESTDKLCDFLLENKIKYIPVDSYNRANEETRTVFVFAQTRHESKLIDTFMEDSDVKFLRQIIR